MPLRVSGDGTATGLGETGCDADGVMERLGEPADVVGGGEAGIGLVAVQPTKATGKVTAIRIWASGRKISVDPRIAASFANRSVSAELNSANDPGAAARCRRGREQEQTRWLPLWRVPGRGSPERNRCGSGPR